MEIDTDNRNYVAAWNRVIKALRGKDKMVCDSYLESFRDAANRGLLHYKNVEACQAVLDCTDEFIKSGKVPNPR